VLEELNPESLEDLAAELARHYDLGGDPTRAAGHYYRSACRARAAYADDEALEACARALELATSSQLRFDVLTLQEEIHHRRGERQAQLDDLLQLESLQAELGDSEAVCEVLQRQIRRYRALGDRRAEGELIAALKKAAKATGKQFWQATALQREAAYEELLSHYDRTRTLLEEALPLFRALGDIDGQVRCLCLLARIDGLQSRFDSARSHLKHAEAMAGAQGDRALLIRTMDAAARAAFNARDFPTSLALSEQLLAICRAIYHREGEADAHARMAPALARMYRVAEAGRHYDLAAAQYAELGKKQGLAAVLLNSGMLAVNMGQYAEGMQKFRQAESLFESMEDLRGVMLSALNTSAAAIYSGVYAQAVAATRKSLELARQINVPFVEAISLGNMGEAELNLGRRAEAIAHLNAALRVRKEGNLPDEESGADMSVLVVAYLSAGQLEEARQTADRLLELYRAKSDTLPYPHWALWALARASRALGQDARALEFLDQAYQVLQEKADAIRDPETQTTFKSLPFNRQLLRAHEEGLWPTDEMVMGS
jgi:tetratricopeptide (TPR) repeat protein